MINNITKKDIALEITLLYAETLLTMEEIANEYSKNNFSFKLNASTISNMIYYCIFLNLISDPVEKRIIEKIVDNRKRHCKYPERVRESLYSKYNKTTKDRAEYLKLCDYIIFLSSYKTLLSEYEEVSEISMNLENYISSEDERYYNGPRSLESIKNDIENYEIYFKLHHIEKNKIDELIFNTKKRADFIKSIYERI